MRHQNVDVNGCRHLEVQRVEWNKVMFTDESSQGLRNALHAAWDNLTPDVFRHYVNSMRQRIIVVLANQGGHTRY